MQHRPIKKFGQNFLTQPAIAEKIVDALEIAYKDRIIEIGPGKGILSCLINDKHPGDFFAVEIDHNLVQKLNEQYKGKIKVIKQDFLHIDLSRYQSADYKTKVIGNIPYNITSPILFKLADHFSELECAVLMMQKEVARRLVATAGNKDYGILSILMQTYSDIDYLFDVGRKNFNPEPRVDSAVVKLLFRKEIEGIDNVPLFKDIVRSVFNYRRKMIRNSLIRIFDQSIVTSLNDFDLTKRPEQFYINDFKKLANTINKHI